MEVHSISDIGKLIISFSDEMIVPETLSDLELKELSVFGEEKPNLELSINPVLSQSKEDVAFTWTIEKFTPTRLSIQIYFKNPSAISNDILEEPNELVIKVWNRRIFTRDSDKEMVKYGTEKRKIIPTQRDKMSE